MQVPRHNDSVTYVVVGLPRSGTSAMMGSLIIGGIPGNFDPGVDKYRRHPFSLIDPTYDPNPKGFFEGRKVSVYQAQGMVTKMVFHLIDYKRTPPEDLKCVVMRREQVARERSLAKWGTDTANRVDFEAAYKIFKDWAPDAELTVVDYEVLVGDPYKVFFDLAAKGWPIHPAIAEKFIDAALNRHGG